MLARVAGNEGLSQTDIVNLTGIDRSTLADIVRRLVKKGLLQRRRTKQDARAAAQRLYRIAPAYLRNFATVSNLLVGKDPLTALLAGLV